MLDRLTAVAADVRDEAVARAGDPLVVRNALREAEHPAPQLVVLNTELVRGDDVLPRDDEHVHRCLRVDVANGEDRIVLSHVRRGDLVPADAAEETVTHAGMSVPRRAPASTASARTRSSAPRLSDAASGTVISWYPAVRPCAPLPSTASHTTSCTRPSAARSAAARVRCAARCTSALRRRAVAGSTRPSAAAAGVSGRGDHRNTWQPRNPTSSTSASVSRWSPSVSPGNPTITSVVNCVSGS